MLGEFVWTGFDYLGEPTPYFDGRGAPTTPTGRRAVPTSASWISPAFRRTASTSTRATGPPSRWSTPAALELGRAWKGKPIPVMCYTNAEEVELFLNGKSLGRKKRFSEPVELPVGNNAGANGKFVASTG